MIRVGFKSDSGMMRSKNEDSCFIMPKEQVYIVADGVGGENTGERASGMVVTSIAESVKKSGLLGMEDEEDISKALDGFIEDSNSRIREYAFQHTESFGMATTVVLAYIKENRAFFANAGDSRAYIYRNGKLYQVTEDHSYVNILVKKGLISADEARTHENRNKITKAVGAEGRVCADHYQTELLDGDRLILCSDGLYSELTDDEICVLIRSEDDMSKLAEKMVIAANLHGGRDNITVVCLKVEGGSWNE